MMKYILFISLFFLNFTLFSHEEIPLKMRFDEKELKQNSNGKWIEIRGFIYSDDTGLTILSNEPNLRSCCAGSKNKRTKQILVLGELKNSPISQTLITLEGRLFRNKTEKGPLYRLEEAKIIEHDEQNTTLVWTIVIILIAVLFCFMTCKKIRKHI